jgi:hypothetical protein
MKKIFLSAVVAFASFIASSQVLDYSLDNIKKYEKFLFDRYDINYAGGWTRFLCVTGQVNNLDPKTKESVTREYLAFQKFNKNYFQQVPIKTPLFDIKFFSIGKEYESEFIDFISQNSNENIVGLYEKQVNDSDFNIKSIIILETYTKGVDSAFDGIFHVILVKGFNNKYRIVSSADEFINFNNLECPNCIAEY